MSLRATRWAWDQKIPRSEKGVLVALADHADEAGECWPSVASLAEKCGASVRTVRRSLRALESRSLIGTTKRLVPGIGVQTSNLFSLLIPGQSDRLPGQTDRETRPERPPHPARLTAESSSRISKENLNLSSSPSATEPDGFAEFWEAYPRKVSKPAARKAWKAQKVNGALPEVLGALERFKASPKWQEKGGEFIPHPASWLNGRRWEDEEPTQNSKTFPRNPLDHYEMFSNG